MKRTAKKLGWLVFLAKTYILAVPIAVLISRQVDSVIRQHRPDVLLTSYWDARLQSSIIASETVEKFRHVETGYIVCLIVLLVNAYLVKSKKNDAECRSSLLFAAMAIVLMLFFYLGTVGAP
jgi:hypothetical protein